MTTVNGTSQTSFDYTALNKTSTTSVSSMGEQQDRFMKLLVAQLQNQDPMNPMESAEMTSQMAQINTVTGIEKLNTTMTQMLSTFNAGQAVQAAGLIGHEILASGRSMAFDGSTPATAALDLENAASSVLVNIYDAKGALVNQVALQEQAAGTVSFSWDGKLADGSTAPAGNYTVTAQGVVDGKNIALDTQTWQRVGSVAQSSEGVKLVLANGSKFDYSAVSQIR